MSLRLLPDLTFPITQAQVNPLMDNVQQLNRLDAGITNQMQRALAINFHIYDLWVKSGFRIDYREPGGHARMMQDATTFISTGNPICTKHGDVEAAHLSLDYHDCQSRLMVAGKPLLPSDVNLLVKMCVDLSNYPQQTEQRVSLLLNYLSKRH